MKRHPLASFKNHLFVCAVGIYPALALLSNNINEVQWDVAVRPLLFSLILTLIVWGVFFLFLRNITKAALLSSVFLLIFFSYGHLYQVLSGFSVGQIVLGKHRFLTSFSIIVFLLFTYGIIKLKKKHARKIVPVLSLISITLIILPLLQIGSYFVRDLQSKKALETETGRVAGAFADGVDKRPDIYYIILDMYTRDDVLMEEMGYDNSPFLNSLSQMGFSVTRCTQSNYGQTQLSLAASLNMNYLPSLGTFPEESIDRTQLDDLIEHSAVRSYLESVGYHTVSLSAYTPLKIESVNFYFSTDPGSLPVNSEASLLNSFEAMFFQSTALLVITDLPFTQQMPFVRNINYPYLDHIRQQLYILDQVKNIPELPGPKFVFVHIQIPHPPFVFGPAGEIVADPPPFPSNPAKPVPVERVYSLYTDQVTYINNRITHILQEILGQYPDDPTERPIVVLQGDHGILLERRTPVLNAYLLPPGQQESLYPSISPVNTFRFIFDQNFGTGLGLIEDISYDSSYAAPFLFTRAPESREGCIAER